MPNDNIKRAIQRGTGELEGASYEEITFEGYGPGGVAVIVEVTTDNRNRAVSEIRHCFSKNGGNLGESNSVRFMFSKKGIIVVSKNVADEEKLMDIVLENGGDDLNDEGDTWEIITEPAAYEAVPNAIKAAEIHTEMAEITMIASTYTKLEGSAAAQMIRLLEALEDMDDTQNVYSNFDMDAKPWKKSRAERLNRNGAEGRQNGGLLFGPDSSGHADQKTRRQNPFMEICKFPLLCVLSAAIAICGPVLEANAQATTKAPATTVS